MWLLGASQIAQAESIIWTVTKISIIATVVSWFLGAIGAGAQAKFIRIVTTVGVITLVAWQIMDLYTALKGLK